MRIVVVGSSGSGKSTLARRLAASFGLPHIEMDALHWGPGWTPRPADELIRRAEAATAAEAWVADGNYTRLRPVVWVRATHLIWLDYPRRIFMARVIRRTLLRALRRTELWNGNREDPRKWHRASHPIRWTWRTWQDLRARTEAGLRDPDHAHLSVLHLRHPREVEAALQRLHHAAG